MDFIEQIAYDRYNLELRGLIQLYEDAESKNILYLCKLIDQYTNSKIVQNIIQHVKEDKNLTDKQRHVLNLRYVEIQEADSSQM